MKTNIVIDISPPIPYPTKLWVSVYGPKCCQPIILQDSLKCNISRKKWMMNFIFDMQINIKVFYQLTLSFRVCVTRSSQSPQNKFAYLAIAPEKHGRWSWFFSADKHKTFLKLIVSFWMCIVTHAQSTQKNKFTISLKYLKKNMTNEVDFLPANKRQRFLQSDTIILKSFLFLRNKFFISPQKLSDKVDFFACK